MTLHYHGTPLSPRSVLRTLGGKLFCVSFARPDDVEICHQIGQGCMLDNGAFSFWRSGKAATNWTEYYKWSEKWLTYPTTWAVIPDVIDGTPEDNDNLLSEWPHDLRGAPVWHLHESIDRALSLCQDWPIVCFGSSGKFATVGDDRWRRRIDEAFNQLSRTGPIPWVHMLRGMALSGSEYPFASVDSTDVARNHNRGVPARQMADNWDSLQCPAVWKYREQLTILD